MVVLESEEFSTGEKMELMMLIVSIVAVFCLFVLMNIDRTMVRIELKLNRLVNIKNRQLGDYE